MSVTGEISQHTEEYYIEGKLDNIQFTKIKAILHLRKKKPSRNFTTGMDKCLSEALHQTSVN